jgi:tetratricopeptide (TPR) repeat protein
MLYYRDRTRRIAEAHGLPDYSARIYEFYARHYETEGRLALAHDLLLKAQEVCRSLKGGYRELRFVVKLIDFYNDLECWNMSARLLPRAELLEDKVPDTRPTGAFAHLLRSRMARARFLMATGRVDEAEAILAGIKPLAGRQLQRDQLPRLLFAWSEDLTDGGYDDRARELVDEGLAHSKRVHFPYLIPKFHLLRAQLRLRAGDPDGALAAVADFERTTADWPAKYEREWIARDVLVTQVLHARGDADSAATTLLSGLARLNHSLAVREPSTHGYLWLDHNGGLRRELRGWTRSDPPAGYGAELYWRGLYARMGRGAAPWDDPATAAGFYRGLRRIA